MLRTKGKNTFKTVVLVGIFHGVIIIIELCSGLGALYRLTQEIVLK